MPWTCIHRRSAVQSAFISKAQVLSALRTNLFESWMAVQLALKLLLYIKGRSRAGKRLTAWKFSQEAQGGHDGLIGVVGV